MEFLKGRGRGIAMVAWRSTPKDWKQYYNCMQLGFYQSRYVIARLWHARHSVCVVMHMEVTGCVLQC